MRLRRCRYSILLLMLLAGCTAAPRAQETLAVPTPAATPTALAVALTAAPAQPSSSPVPTAIPTALPSPDTAAVPIETSPPPTPDVPLGQALQRFAGNALLFTRESDRFLMLADADGQQLWLTADTRFCGRSNSALSQGGTWSSDGRYLAIACQDDGNDSKLLGELATMNVLDMTTGQLHRVDVGSSEARGIRVDAAAGLWSPDARQLLISTNRMTAVEPNTDFQYRSGWSVFDVAVKTMHELITFDPDGGMYSNAAWSPDSARVAVVGRRVGEAHADVYVINMNGPTTRRLHLDNVKSFYGFGEELAWSSDDRYLLLNRQLKSSSDAYIIQILHVDVGSGAVTVLADTLTDWPTARWSPDGKWFLLRQYATPDRTIVAWSLHHADGTLARTFSSDAARSVEDLAWLPDGRLAFVVNRVNFGVELIIADQDGNEQVIATRPSAFAHRIAAAPDGALLAIEFDDNIIVFNRQGHIRATFDGRSRLWGWRPKPS